MRRLHPRNVFGHGLGRTIYAGLPQTRARVWRAEHEQTGAGTAALPQIWGERLTSPAARPLIRTVLLPGDDGEGFWPVARAKAPGWLQPLFGARSPLQETAAALEDGAVFAKPLLAIGSNERFLAAQQLVDIGVDVADIILTPAPFDRFRTAAIAVAHLAAANSDGIVLLSAADRPVRSQDRRAFARAMAAAAVAAEPGRAIRFACPSSAAGSDAPTDAGWLLAPASLLAELFEAVEAGTWQAAQAAVANAAPDLDFLRIAASDYAKIPSQPFQRLLEAADAVTDMHALDAVPRVAADWASLRVALADRQDSDGNLTEGDALLLDASNCYVNAGERLVVAAGVSDLAVVVTDDVVFVADLNDPSAAIVAAKALRAEGRAEASSHPQEQRPWGGFKRLTEGHRYQVKRLTMKPGGATSLQKHHHRAEHWVVVAGTAEVTIDGETRILQENESAYLPLGCAHRLANPGKILLAIIEVQSGSYLGEDDIIRLDDPYKRTDD